MEFTGKRIWLVGASEGIGEALARRLAAEGARLTLSARSGDKLTQLIARLAGTGHQALALDVTKYEMIEESWQRMTGQGSLPDIVIYNAGAYEPMGAKEFRLEQAEQMLNVNYHGALRVLSFVLPAFLTRGSGRIVLVGSVAGYSGLPRAIGYGPSKAAILHLAENLKVDLAQTAIIVQLVSPGFVKTRLTDKNSFDMPFIMDVDAAAKRISEGMRTGRFEIHFPRRLSVFLKTPASATLCIVFPLCTTHSRLIILNIVSCKAISILIA